VINKAFNPKQTEVRPDFPYQPIPKRGTKPAWREEDGCPFFEAHKVQHKEKWRWENTGRVEIGKAGASGQVVTRTSLRRLDDAAIPSKNPVFVSFKS